MSKKIYIVSEYTDSNQNSTGYFWEQAITKLINEGLQVEVITLKRPIKDSIRTNIIKRALTKIRAALVLTWLVASKANRDSIVFCGTNPETLLAILAVLKRVLGFRFYVLVHDVFPENLIPAGVISPKNHLYRTIKSVFDWVYTQPEKLFVIGRDMKEIIDKKTNGNDKAIFIHNWVDSKKITPINKSESNIIKELKWENKTVFLFFGNIGRLQALPQILEAINKSKSPRAAFLFIGNGTETQRVINFIKKNPNKCLHYISKIPQSEKNSGLAACDVALVPLSKGMYGLGVPSKAYFSMAADRPIFAIMDKGSEISLMVEEEKIGWTCNSENPIEIAQKIDEICASDLTAYEKKVRNIAFTKYSQESALNILIKCIKTEDLMS